MPARLSKFTINASCKEYVHPWTDSCVSATAGLGLHSLQECLRIYSTVYLITLLLKGRTPSKTDIKRTVLGILQSTAFLSWSSFAYSIFLCSLRRVTGNFNIITVSFLPSFLSSLTAIILERPSRRTLLCLYVSNIATETLFRMGVWRGYFSMVPRGEVYIFAVSTAVLMYLFRGQGKKEDTIFKIIRFIIGKYEEPECLERRRSLPSSEDAATVTLKDKRPGDVRCSKNQVFSAVWQSLKVYEHIIGRLKALSKHPSCQHPHSCAHYILSGGARMFSYGVCAQLAFKLIFQAKLLFRKPKLLKSTVFRRNNLYLATFVGGFAGGYRLFSCLLRRTLGRDSRCLAVPAGLIASAAFLMYPDNTVALYVMWKTLQLLWNNAAESGKVPDVKWFVIFLYCFSTATLFHAAIIEPQNLRPSYWKFLHNLSGGRIATMARKPLDEFGLESSAYLQKVLKLTRTTDQNTYSF